MRMMDETEATRILGTAIRADGSLDDVGEAYAAWPTSGDTDKVNIDGRVSADELEAIAWWMRNKGKVRQ